MPAAFFSISRRRVQPGRMDGMDTLARAALLFGLATLSLLGGTGCAGLLNTAVTRNVTRDVYSGVPRGAVVRRLGPPRQTRRFEPPVALNTFPDAPTDALPGKAALCDDYQVSGLLVTSSDPGREQWHEAYPLALFVTGGFAEAVYLPTTVADLSARSVRRYHLRFYYDRVGILLGESRRFEPLPLPPPGSN